MRVVMVMSLAAAGYVFLRGVMPTHWKWWYKVTAGGAAFMDRSLFSDDELVGWEFAFCTRFAGVVDPALLRPVHGDDVPHSIYAGGRGNA